MKSINVISNFKDKKLVEYLKDGMRVMILFNWHGMGDCIMFLPLYYKLKKMYPNVSFNLKCNVGQEIFDDINDKEYDIYFDIIFPEFNDKRYYPHTVGKSKPHICCCTELGIPFSKEMEFTWKPDKIIDSGISVPKNSVGVAFHNIRAFFKIMIIGGHFLFSLQQIVKGDIAAFAHFYDTDDIRIGFSGFPI